MHTARHQRTFTRSVSGFSEQKVRSATSDLICKLMVDFEDMTVQKIDSAKGASLPSSH
jgi:hypothetical protein